MKWVTRPLDKRIPTCYNNQTLKRMGTTASTSGETAALRPAHSYSWYWRFS